MSKITNDGLIRSGTHTVAVYLQYMAAVDDKVLTSS